MYPTITKATPLDLVLDLCPRTIIVLQGEVAANGPTSEVFSDLPLLERCNLEQPMCWRGRER